MNVRFSYLHRDAENYVRRAEVVFVGEGHEDVDDLAEDLAAACHERDRFMPGQVWVPDVHWEPALPLDEPWHEVTSLTYTGKPATDYRTIGEFVEDVRQAARAGWVAAFPIPAGAAHDNRGALHAVRTT